MSLVVVVAVDVVVLSGASALHRVIFTPPPSSLTITRRMGQGAGGGRNEPTNKYQHMTTRGAAGRGGETGRISFYGSLEEIHQTHIEHVWCYILQ